MFHKRLRMVREKRQLTQSEFSQLIGVSLGAQNNYERGLRMPTVDYLVALEKNGFDSRYVLTGITTDINALSYDEKELLLNFRMSKQIEQQVLLTVSRSFINDGSSDQDPDDEDGSTVKIDKKITNNKKLKAPNMREIVNSNSLYSYCKKRYAQLMTIGREVTLCRTHLFSSISFIAVFLAMLGMGAIDYVMMIGNNFNAPEYDWLATTVNIVMLTVLIAALSKWVIQKLSPLCEKDEQL